MHRLALLLLSCTLAFGAETVRILRDEFGVPHIFAATAAGAAYGSGYAQAEDRLEELLRNYRKAEGTMSEVFGENWFRHDYRQRLWRHRRVVQAGLTPFLPAHPDHAADSAFCGPVATDAGYGK